MAAHSDNLFEYIADSTVQSTRQQKVQYHNAHFVVQVVKRRCVGKHAPDGIEVLPFDLTGSIDALQQAAEQAAGAFPGSPVSYLVHNAGEPFSAVHHPAERNSTARAETLNPIPFWLTTTDAFAA